MNTILCNTTRRNVSWKQFCKLNLSAYRKVIVVPVGASLTTLTANTKSAWEAKIVATPSDRFIPLPPAFNVKTEDQEDVFSDTAFEGKKFIRNGKEGFTLEIEASPYVQERLWTINRTACAVYIVDANENILGWSSNGTDFLPFSVELLHVHKMGQSDGSNPRTINISVVLSNPNEWNAYPQVIIPEAGFIPTELEGLYDLQLTSSAAATTGIVVNVSIMGTGKGLNGLIVGDWIVKNGSGVTQTLATASAVSGTDGSYTLIKTAGFTAGAHTVELVAASALSIKTTIPSEMYGSALDVTVA